MYNKIIFDLDGTLLNTQSGIVNALKTALSERKFKLSDDEILKKFVGPPIHESFMKYFDLTYEQAKENVCYFRKIYSENCMFDACLYDGIYDLLENLKKQNKKLAIATNKSHNNACRIIEHFKLDKYMDFYMGSDMDGKLKKSDIVLKCIEKVNSKKSDCVLIGDSSHDETGAKIAGIDFIPVSYGFGFKDRGYKNIFELKEKLLLQEHS